MMVLSLINGMNFLITEETAEKITTLKSGLFRLPGGELIASHQIACIVPRDIFLQQDTMKLSANGRFRCRYGVAHKKQDGCQCGLYETAEIEKIVYNHALYAADETVNNLQSLGYLKALAIKN